MNARGIFLRALVVTSPLILAPAQARAQDQEAMDTSQDPIKEELKQLGQRMPGVAAEAGREAAPVQKPGWCEAVVERNAQAWRPLTLARTFESWKTNGVSGLVDAARISCIYGSDPNGQRAAAMIAQTWINLTGLSYADTVESLRARVDKEAWERDHKKLCDAVTVSEEVRGEERAFTRARRALFGCPRGAQWAEGGHPPDDLVAFLDQSATRPDELARLSLILDRSAVGDGARTMDQAMTGYAIDSYDYRGLSDSEALKQLEAAGYANNAYARAIVKESLGRAHIGINALDNEAKKRSSDPDWNEILVSAPRHAIDAYVAAAQKYKAELARSNELERKLLGPSKRAVAGCEPALRSDFLTVLRKLEHGTLNATLESLSDPIAALLFSRLQACLAVDGDANLAGAMQANLTRNVRYARGARTAAYYGELEAVGKVRADRERFPLKPEDLNWVFNRKGVLDEVDYGKRATLNYVLNGHGTIKTATRTGNGLRLSFAHESHKEMSVVCVDTNRIVQIRSDGTIQYYRKCHEAGMITVNDTAQDVTVPPTVAEGLAPGRSVEFLVTPGGDDHRLALPTAIYADKSKKRLLGFYGFVF
jgi:hypothetical protein